MFALFFSLYYSMFHGSWNEFNLIEINNVLKDSINAIGTLITSIFGDNQMTTLGDTLMNLNSTYYTTNWISLTAFILALITSIGIVFAAGKVLKKIFGVFFVIGR